MLSSVSRHPTIRLIWIYKQIIYLVFYNRLSVAGDYVKLFLIVRTDEGRLCESVMHASSVIVLLQNKTNKNVETSYIH
jgi:hypothetical protein